MSLDAIHEIRSAQTGGLVDEDGDAIELELRPGLSSDELEELRAELGIRLPDDLRALLQHTAGIDGPAELDFTGRSLSFGDRDVFPAGLPIASDGFGNFWVLDLTPDTTATAPVFFASHDPPVVLYQSPDLGDFLHEWFRLYVPPHASLVDDVHEDRLFHVWGENPGTIEQAEALAGDDDLRAFAAELDEHFVFVDLRSAEIGMGFSWGRHGPRTRVRRHGHERVFAYAPPERKQTLLRRLFV